MNFATKIIEVFKFCLNKKWNGVAKHILIQFFGWNVFCQTSDKTVVCGPPQQQSGSLVGQRACYQQCITELLGFYRRLTGVISLTLTNNELRAYCKIGAVQYSLNMVQLTTPGILIILGPEMATFHNLQHIQKAYYHIFPLNLNTFKKAKANSRYLIRKLLYSCL